MIDILNKKVATLGFKLSYMSGNIYQLLFPGTSFGYKGSIAGCIAYLQGWEEQAKFQSHRW